ncbi:hypothetical protein FACS189496_5420 [Bacilli bacterium]|nr:hypothetical protein FACS189496_5420 [Bacilli bacterium]
MKKKHPRMMTAEELFEDTMGEATAKALHVQAVANEATELLKYYKELCKNAKKRSTERKVRKAKE